MHSATKSTSRWGELNVINFTETSRENGGRCGMVAEPVRAIRGFRAVDPDHEVPICQNLSMGETHKSVNEDHTDHCLYS